jgi:hypothetical protein
MEKGAAFHAWPPKRPWPSVSDGWTLGFRSCGSGRAADGRLQAIGETFFVAHPIPCFSASRIAGFVGRLVQRVVLLRLKVAVAATSSGLRQQVFGTGVCYSHLLFTLATITANSEFLKWQVFTQGGSFFRKSLLLPWASALSGGAMVVAPACELHWAAAQAAQAEDKTNYPRKRS